MRLQSHNKYHHFNYASSILVYVPLDLILSVHVLTKTNLTVGAAPRHIVGRSTHVFAKQVWLSNDTFACVCIMHPFERLATLF